MYGIRNCDTVKKARAWLEAAGVRVVVGFKPPLYQSLDWK